MLRGVTILPKQHLTIDKWVTFNNLPSNLNPLYSAIAIDLDGHADTHIIHILLETQIYPDLKAIESGVKIVSVSEKFLEYHNCYTIKSCCITSTSMVIFMIACMKQ